MHHEAEAGHKIYPYLLRGMSRVRTRHVATMRVHCTDITYTTAKLTKILAKFSLHLTSVFIVFVSITSAKIHLSSTPTLYESQASMNV